MGFVGIGGEVVGWRGPRTDPDLSNRFSVGEGERRAHRHNHTPITSPYRSSGQGQAAVPTRCPPSKLSPLNANHYY